MSASILTLETTLTITSIDILHMHDQKLKEKLKIILLLDAVWDKRVARDNLFFHFIKD